MQNAALILADRYRSVESRSVETAPAGASRNDIENYFVQFIWSDLITKRFGTIALLDNNKYRNLTVTFYVKCTKLAAPISIEEQEKSFQNS